MARLNTLRPRVAPIRTSRVHSHTMTEHRRLRGAEWEALRLQIFARDFGLCQPCKREGRIHSPYPPICDHVVPQWEGGTDAPANLQTICKDCHDAKSAIEQRRRFGQG